jgi:hypothetical protein
MRVCTLLLLSLVVCLSLSVVLITAEGADHRHRRATLPPATPDSLQPSADGIIRIPLHHRVPSVEQRKRVSAYRQSIRPNPVLFPLRDVRTQEEYETYLEKVKRGVYPALALKDNPILPQKDYGDVEYVGQIAIGTPSVTFSGLPSVHSADHTEWRWPVTA